MVGAQVGEEAEEMSMTLPDEMTVAVLCAARRSVYKSLPGLEVYDIDRDARSFPGGMPVIAHPPCRLWSAYCRHQAKADDPEAERELGLFCARMVRENGGVLEQPAHSVLFTAAGLPKPGSLSTETGFSIEVSQYWFGDSREKATWLYFSGLSPLEVPQMPIRLKPDGGDRRIWQLMSSKNQRERTPLAFAEWLVQCARSAKTFTPKPTRAI